MAAPPVVRLRFAGGGRMATALLAGLIARGREPGSLSVADPSEEARHRLARAFPGLVIHDSVRAMLDAGNGGFVVAVKPQEIEPVMREASAAPPAYVLSVAAGTTTARIESFFASPVPVMRAMPNTPALVGRGISALAAGRHAGMTEMKAARDILDAVGETVIVDESALDAVTAVSGSGPAYFFLFTDALARAGEALGLDRDLALRLALATAAGSAELARSRSESLAEQIAAVASKGGTTERALAVFRERGMESIVAEACTAAARRAKELAS